MARKDSSKQDNPNVVTLSSGVQVNIRPVPPYIIGRIRKTISEPKPPIVTVKTAWGGEEQWANKEDPTYKKALAEAEELQAAKVWKAQFILGVADDPPDDGDWLDMLEAFGIEVPDDPKERKLLWIESICLKETDVLRLVGAIGQLGRPTKEEISEMADSFRSQISWLKTESEETE